MQVNTTAFSKILKVKQQHECFKQHRNQFLHGRKLSQVYLDRVLVSTAHTERLKAETAVLMYLLFKGPIPPPTEAYQEGAVQYLSSCEYFQVTYLNRFAIY